MAIAAGLYKYKDYDINFWVLPKTIKATVWRQNTLILVKRFYARNKPGGYVKLKKRIIEYVDDLQSVSDGDN